MSNRVRIEPTLFQDLDENLNEIGEVKYGFRMFDDEGQSYSTVRSTKEKMENALNEYEGERYEQWIGLAMSHYNKEIEAMFDVVRDQANGIYVGENWYTWEQIKKTLESD